MTEEEERVRCGECLQMVRKSLMRSYGGVMGVCLMCESCLEEVHAE